MHRGLPWQLPKHGMKALICIPDGAPLFQKWKQQNVMEQMFALSKVYTMTPIKKPVNCSRKAEVPLFIRLMMKMIAGQGSIGLELLN